MAQPKDRNSSLIANCVFNAFLSCTAIMLNIITILALRKTSSMPKTLKTLLLSLAVSDIGVGLLVQPLYVAYLVMEMEQNTETQTFKITRASSIITRIFLSWASFFGIVALTADRFLAIHLHLRYQELVTHKRVVAVVISSWVLSAIVALILNFRNWIPANVSKIILVTIRSLCYLTTALFYFKIYLAVRHHSNQIYVLQAQLAQNGEAIANAARQRKSAVGTFYVYLVFLACYLPNTSYWSVAGRTSPNTVAWHLELYIITLVLLNSTLNPLIYCWKMIHIRHAAMDIVRNILPSRN